MPIFFPGYLQEQAPPPPQPLEGKPLLQFLQGVFVGVLAMDGTLMRPRWQAEPPNIPDKGTAWCSFGITRRVKDTNAVELHNPSAKVVDPGSSTIIRQEQLEILASFYDNGVSGQADLLAELLCDGFQVSQNRETLQAQGFAFVATGEPTPLPSLLKEQWLYRVDVPITIRRQIERVYSVPTIQSADITIVTDRTTPNGPYPTLTIEIHVEPPSEQE